jgi:hypothetical protein
MEATMARQQEMQNLVHDWVEGQQKLWQEWMQNVQVPGAGQPWSGGMERWQQAVEQTLETQKQATRAWADQVAAMEGVPQEMKRWASEGVRLVEQWTDAQHELWQQWFHLMGQAAPGAAMGDEPVKQLMAGWDQMAGQMQALQQQWASTFAGMSQGASGQGGAKAPGGGRE